MKVKNAKRLMRKLDRKRALGKLNHRDLNKHDQKALRECTSVILKGDK